MRERESVHWGPFYVRDSTRFLAIPSDSWISRIWGDFLRFSRSILGASRSFLSIPRNSQRFLARGREGTPPKPVWHGLKPSTICLQELSGGRGSTLLVIVV